MPHRTEIQHKITPKSLANAPTFAYAGAVATGLIAVKIVRRDRGQTPRNPAVGLSWIYSQNATGYFPNPCKYMNVPNNCGKEAE